MLKNIFITILLICSVSGVWGQKSVKVKVSGNVITTDGVPAEFINIQLKNTFYGGTSDGKGYFEFMAPAGQYTMIVQSIAAHRREFPVTIEERTDPSESADQCTVFAEYRDRNPVIQRYGFG